MSPRRGPSPVREQPAAKKSLGQHFLRDGTMLAKIARAIDEAPGRTVLEVGPGTGNLTEELLRTGSQVIAVDIDERMYDHLRQRFPAEARLRLVLGNVLEYDPGELVRNDPDYKLAGNLPYFLASAILRHFLESSFPPRSAVIMVQKEVAREMAAKAGDMSLLSVGVQVFGQPHNLFDVPPEAFSPPPKVRSTVVRIDLYPEPLVPREELRGLFEVVRAGFKQPRKQIHNSLAGGLWLPPGGVHDALRRAGIDPMRRAQTLTIPEWYALYRLAADVRAEAAQ